MDFFHIDEFLVTQIHLGNTCIQIRLYCRVGLSTAGCKTVPIRKNSKILYYDPGLWGMTKLSVYN